MRVGGACDAPLPDPRTLKGGENMGFKVKVDTVTVSVRQGDDCTILEIPAFTRDRILMGVIIHDHMDDYLIRSEEQGEPVSLGDFCMYLLSKASQEPFEM
jgi:hypothetical protein